MNIEEKYLIEKQETNNLYQIGWALFVLAFLGSIYLIATDFMIFEKMIPCILRTYTGFYCPGCGGTRAVVHLLKGKIFQSFIAHPVVLYGIGLYLLFMFTNAIQRISKDRFKIGILYRDYYMWIALGIVIGNLIIKNIWILLYGGSF